MTRDMHEEEPTEFDSLFAVSFFAGALVLFMWSWIWWVGLITLVLVLGAFAIGWYILHEIEEDRAFQERIRRRY